jgi:hypothetical protein
MQRIRFAIGALMLLSFHTSADGQTICKPTVSRETESCGSDHIQTFVRANNTCDCDATVTIDLKKGGSTVLLVSKNSTKRDMIEACGPPTQSGFTYKFDFSCPKEKPAQGGPAQRPSVTSPNANSEQPKSDIARRLDVAKTKVETYQATRTQQQERVVREERSAVAERQAEIDQKANERAAREAEAARDPYSQMRCFGQPGGRVCFDPNISGSSCTCVGIVGGVNTMRCAANHERGHSDSHNCR